MNIFFCVLTIGSLIIVSFLLAKPTIALALILTSVIVTYSIVKIEKEHANKD